MKSLLTNKNLGWGCFILAIGINIAVSHHLGNGITSIWNWVEFGAIMLAFEGGKIIDKKNSCCQ